MKQTAPNHNLILLIDQTQAMQSHKPQFTKHINDFLLVQQYVSGAKKHAKSYNDLDITVYTYDNSLKLQKQKTPVQDFKQFDENDFAPAYCVPLYQVLERMLDDERVTEKDGEEYTQNTTVVVISEATGILSENVDSHLTANLSKRLLKTKTEYNWKFIHAVNTSGVCQSSVIHSPYKFDETYSSSKWDTLWFTIGDKVLYQRMKARKRSNSGRKRANSGRKNSSRKSSEKSSEAVKGSETGIPEYLGTFQETDSVETCVETCTDLCVTENFDTNSCIFDTNSCETGFSETNSMKHEHSYSEPSLPTEGALIEEKLKIPRNKSLVEFSQTRPVLVKKRGESTSFSCDEGIVGSAW